MICLKRKRHLCGAEKLKWFLHFSGIDISGKCQQTKLFTHVQDQKKAMLLRHSAYTPSKVISLMCISVFCMSCIIVWSVKYRNYTLNILLRAYNLITKSNTRSLNIFWITKYDDKFWLKTYILTFLSKSHLLSQIFLQYSQV